MYHLTSVCRSPSHRMLTAALPGPEPLAANAAQTQRGADHDDLCRRRSDPVTWQCDGQGSTDRRRTKRGRHLKRNSARDMRLFRYGRFHQNSVTASKSEHRLRDVAPNQLRGWRLQPADLLPSRASKRRGEAWAARYARAIRHRTARHQSTRCAALEPSILVPDPGTCSGGHRGHC